MNEITVKRLAFIKYVWRRADETAQEPEPLCAAAVLSFHDAVELFLQLASEHVDSGASRPDFLDYWDLIGKKISGGLSHKEAMRRLNKSRIALKHHGTMPSILDIQGFRSVARDFFDENTPRVFGSSFDSVNLVAFVSPEETRENLAQAAAFLERNDVEKSLEASAQAFFYFLLHTKKVVSNRWGISPFEPTSDLRHYRGAFFEFRNIEDRDGELSKFAQDVTGALADVHDVLRLMALGVDYHRFLRFKQATPHVNQTLGGTIHLVWGTPAVRSPEYTPQLAQFCIDFVVDASLSFMSTSHIHGLFVGQDLLGRDRAT